MKTCSSISSAHEMLHPQRLGDISRHCGTALGINYRAANKFPHQSTPLPETSQGRLLSAISPLQPAPWQPPADRPPGPILGPSPASCNSLQGSLYTPVVPGMHTGTAPRVLPPGMGPLCHPSCTQLPPNIRGESLKLSFKH